MYKYSDFADRFGEYETERKMFDIYKFMQNQQIYTTEELFKPVSGDSWETLACIDRLCELGLIRCADNLSARNYWRYKKV